jgi:hypothetical protein
MNEKILKRLEKEFSNIGDEKISGNDAMKIIHDVIEELTIPKEVEEAQKFIDECHRDMGFCGSPEYYKKKKIVDDYFEPILKKEIEDKEKEMYLQLKEKYGN